MLVLIWNIKCPTTQLQQNENQATVYPTWKIFTNAIEVNERIYINLSLKKDTTIYLVLKRCIRERYG